MRRRLSFIVLLAGACGGLPEEMGDGIKLTTDLPTRPARGGAATSAYAVVRTLPHDPSAFTEGLVFVDGVFYESTGRYGSSALRRVDPETGRVLKERTLPAEYFGEGMTLFRGNIFQLTYREHTCFVYDAATFEPRGQLAYAGEGWGLTNDGERLVMSDGTSTLRFRDPATLAVVRTMRVEDLGRPVEKLNELEYVDGEIYANVWGEDRIVRIAPATGAVLGWIDLTGILQAPTGDVDVLNGIAYDAAAKRLFVTGKMWPKMFEIKIVPRPADRSF